MESYYVGLIVLLVILVALYVARDKCMLGRFSKAGCKSKGAFCGDLCGDLPSPAAASEALGLHEMGVRMDTRGESFRGAPGCGPGAACGNVPAPAALAEFGGLEALGWRADHMRARPSCGGGAHPAAIAEAHSLQKANALPRTAPYYTPREGFSNAAVGEANLLTAIQADGAGIDEQAVRSLQRARSARRVAEDLHTNPAQVSAVNARMTAMREGFGGPDSPGFGWSPNAADVEDSPETGGWGDKQSVGAAQRYEACMDGCNGTHCADHCADVSRSSALQSATDM